ncbi:hypothetical protein [Vibrio maerlii]|uniref:hypothetical protein n=1 Tax=Vibrio maerlii TaxID=2231648 RepID=UPI000E3D530C|nr:hypothetical protein [Vibrio maerlii]
MKQTAIIIGLTLFIAGCAASNHRNNLKEFDRSVTRGDYLSASEFSLKESGFTTGQPKTNDLLWGLQAGVTQTYLGNFELSTEILDSTEELLSRQDTQNGLKNVSDVINATLINDAVTDYTPTYYDRVFLNTTKAWNFLAQNDYANARVELNRAEERQRMAVVHFEKQIAEQQDLYKESELTQYVQKSVESDETNMALQRAGFQMGRWQPYEGYINPFTTYTYGLNYLINGNSKSDFDQAVDAFERVYQITGSQMVERDLELAKRLSGGDLSARDNKVWVVFSNGQSMIKEERRIDIPMFLFSDRVSYTGIALPRLKERGVAYSSITANGQQTETVADMDRIIASEFDKDFPIILTHEMIRAATKVAAQMMLDEYNEWAGLGAALFAAATTSADIRSFSALPSQFQTAQLERDGNTVNLDLGSYSKVIELDPNSNQHILFVKAATDQTTPLVKVINL